MTRRIRFISCLTAALLLAATSHAAAHSFAYGDPSVVVIDHALPTRCDDHDRFGPSRRESRSQEGYTHPRRGQSQRHEHRHDRHFGSGHRPQYRSHASPR